MFDRFRQLIKSVAVRLEEGLFALARSPFLIRRPRVLEARGTHETDSFPIWGFSYPLHQPQGRWSLARVLPTPSLPPHGDYACVHARGERLRADAHGRSNR